MLLFTAILLTAFVQLNAINIPGIDYPITAQCQIYWEFPSADCASIKNTLLAQIAKWDNENCGSSGQKCLYKLKGTTETEITASHTTPIKRYVDSLTFTFKQEGADCKVSVSKNFFP